MVMSNIKLERANMTTNRPPRVDAAEIGSKTIEFQLELRNRFEIPKELDDFVTISETITYMIQQRALRIAKAINKSQNIAEARPRQTNHTHRQAV